MNNQEIDALEIGFIVHAVHTELGKERTFNQKSLVVFDNAPVGFIRDSLKDQLPVNTDILVTSRDKWTTKLSLFLSDEAYRLTPEEGIQILKQWVQGERFDRVEAEKLVDRFAHLPVVIANAGSYIANTPTMSMQEYLPLFEQNKREILEEGKHSSASLDIVASLRVIIKRLKPQTLDLLLFCAYLPGKNIPSALLIRLLELDQKMLNRHLSALGTLVVCSVGQVTIHDIFQDILLEENLVDKEKYLTKLAMVCEDFLLNDKKKIVPIYEQGVKDAEKRKDYRKTVFFLLKTGGIYSYLGKYSQSLGFNKKALEICRGYFDENDMQTATSYDSVGTSLEELGRYEEALECQQRALEIREKILGKDHPITATSYNNVGSTLGSLGRHKEALKLKQRTLEIRKKILGEDHPSTASSYSNVGISLEALGQLEEALKLQQRALEIWEKTLGEDHPGTATGYNNVGSTLGSLGRYEEALKYKQRALEIKKKVFGEDHPDTATSYDNSKRQR